MKMYKLLGADGKEYLYETQGTCGGNSKQKIYGRLDCPSALSSIKRFPGVYEKKEYSLLMRKRRLPRVIARAETACARSAVNMKKIRKNIGRSLDYRRCFIPKSKKIIPKDLILFRKCAIIFFRW